jgi:hypothetical protein
LFLILSPWVPPIGGVANDRKAEFSSSHFEGTYPQKGVIPITSSNHNFIEKPAMAASIGDGWGLGH